MGNERRRYGACILACALIAGCSGDDDQDDTGSCTGANCPPTSTGSGGSGGATGSTSTSTGGTTVKPIATGGTGGAAPSGSGGMTANMMPSGGSGGATAMLDAGAMQPGIDQPPPTPSAGCGATESPASGNLTIDVAGTAREYIVALPDDYDANTPYKLVFAWHGLGGTAMQVAGGFGGGYYGLQSKAAGSVIFVAGQGLETSSGGAGWPNTGGQDIAFVRAMLDLLRSKYCIDEERIFSVGMSYGGIMSNTIGCELGDVFRAIAPMSGSGPRSFGGAQCVGQVAVWSSHGDMDDVVSTMSGEMSRDHWVMNNHCDTQPPTPVDPSPCVAYQGCDAGFPVTWCEFEGGHTIPPFASQAIWDFLSQF